MSGFDFAVLSVPLLPLLGSAAAGIFGSDFGGRLISSRQAHCITICCVFFSFIISLGIATEVLLNERIYESTLYEWMLIGSLRMEVGFLVDALTVLMMCVVTSVSLMVHIYTIGYMQDDPGYARFFSYISLFTFSMLMLVMSNNLLQLFFGWEAVGLVSYLLIGFWFKKATAIFANMKAFLINRVGDFGFILGIGLIAAKIDSLNYAEIFSAIKGADFSEGSLATMACICLFIGAMGKSAQFPLHAWLPDSMEGPTPISALIHAATMVTAGIFMVSRMSPLFEISDTALNFILLIGSITALFMGVLGIIQNDIKRVIAYSTLSQLGYMTVALGASAYSVAIFHLMTHAFFKALLFLAAGSVIMGMHHNQDIRWMGGVRKYMPITHWTFLLGTLALVGTPFFSGFYSKDLIIEAAEASDLSAAVFAKFSVLLGVFITSFYSFRLYFLVFCGEERYKDNPDAHHHDGHSGDPHESPWVVWLPLAILSIPSVIIGFFMVRPLVFGDFLGGSIHVKHGSHNTMNFLTENFHGALAMGLHGFVSLPFWLALSGAVTAYVFYLWKPCLPQRAKHFFQSIGIFSLMENKYYVDWFNENVVAKYSRLLGVLFWQVGDKKFIDGMMVNGSWRLAYFLSRLSRQMHSGYLYHYAFVMVIALIGMMAYFVWHVS